MFFALCTIKQIVGLGSCLFLNRKIDDECKKFVKAELEAWNKLFSELEPLLTFLSEKAAKSPEIEKFKQAYFEYLKKENHYKKISRYISRGVLKPTASIKVKLQLILWYLCVLETINHTTVNILIVLINTCECKSRTLKTGSRDRFERELQKASSLDDLDKQFIPLGSKIAYLRSNGLKEVVSVIDTKFRNAIVHFDFDVLDDDIVVNEEKIMPLVVENIQNLLRLSAVVSNCLKEI